jgi:hypothetical protein
MPRGAGSQKGAGAALPLREEKVARKVADVEGAAWPPGV